MSCPGELVYVYDGTLDGLLCAVFEAYTRREEPLAVDTGENLQISFGQELLRVKTDEANARRVERGFISKAGSMAWNSVWTAFLSGEPDKATKVYRYIRAGFTLGRGIYSRLTHEDVLPVNEMCLSINNEAHHLKGFTRFSLMENGVFYGRITPKNSVVPLLMPHFADRFSVQPFLLYDPVHGLAGVYDLSEWYMVETSALDLPALSDDELDYRRLWKRFYNAIAVMERKNPKLRRSNLPKRFWHDMVEMRGEG